VRQLHGLEVVVLGLTGLRQVAIVLAVRVVAEMVAQMMLAIPTQGYPTVRVIITQYLEQSILVEGVEVLLEQTEMRHTGLVVLE
jgi:hypothetical protein